MSGNSSRDCTAFELPTPQRHTVPHAITYCMDVPVKQRHDPPMRLDLTDAELATAATTCRAPGARRARSLPAGSCPGARLGSGRDVPCALSCAPARGRGSVSRERVFTGLYARLHLSSSQIMAARSGYAEVNVLASPFTKSWNSNPGAIVVPSNAYRPPPKSLDPCHTPAGTTC